jgi:hydroxymethylpyrimidine pyrophosphatase-like HAD family hydrolase/fructoselysine-6-P-deglycase FrlB-like protein
MGKNYRKELDSLSCIYDRAMEADVEMLTNFLSKYRSSHLFGIGSGGSYSAAAAFEYLCIKAGLTAQKLTPLELGQLQYQLSTSSAVLFTAGGSNNDSKNAYRYLAELEPEGILTCCMRLNAPIKKIQRENIHNYYYEYKMPVVKDGYLAVESLMSSIVLMIRAFQRMMHDDYFLLPKKREWNNHVLDTNIIREVMERESIFVLYGGITMPAAIDLESKFSEVSLGNTQVVDFRNFAHGRHYWISDRRKTTAIIALVGASEKKLADNTLKLLPEDIPVLRVDINDNTIEGLIEALHCGFEIVGCAALIRNFDPGKPHVEEFGKKLYHLNYDIGKRSCIVNRRKDIVEMAAYRKARKHQGVGMSEYQRYSRIYWNNLLSRRYKGIIFDYDGTLHDKYTTSKTEDRLFAKLNELLENNIIIGIATGRGKSVRIELQKKIERKYWKKVLIAYYNGGVIGHLDDDTKPNKKDVKMPKVFNEIIRKISHSGIEENPYQLTLIKEELSMTSAEFQLLKEQILGVKDVKVMETNHSIDIIPVNSSKRNIITEYDLDEQEFLMIGDSGDLGGNDYELLYGDTGLSVDYVSSAFNSCWNYALPGVRNLEATEYYLNMIDIQEKGTFCMRG